jgi:hypothetical protein
MAAMGLPCASGIAIVVRMRRWFFLSFVCSAWSTFAAAQEGVPAPQGLVPEQMWYAPTAEDWKKPVLIQWQRSWEDAVRLSQATKKPILVCVNMDGEIASEHYAGVRYRDAEIAKLFEPYVCVMASVYRHNPRDYDDQGNRIPCPRLGCITCGEHIALEPLVYEKFLDGKRISPRHIMVELDGSEVYDVFYTWDTDSVFQTLRNGIQNRKIQAPPIVKGDRSLKERIASPDSEDRSEVEKQFLAADAEQKKKMLELALEQAAQAPVELLRLAANSLDPDLARRAREGMLQSEDPLAIELIAETLRQPLPAAERQSLVDALARFGADSTHARTLATAHRGMTGSKSAIDGARWREVLAGQSYANAVATVDRSAQAAQRDLALAQRPEDPNARLDVAETSLLQALETAARGVRGGERFAEQQRTLLLEDAATQLAAASKAGATGWRVAAVRAVLAQQQGDLPKAYELAVATAPELPPDAPGRLAMELLTLFAHARQEAIRDAVRTKKQWPPEWNTDVHTTYSLLLQHPLGTDRHAADHYDWLEFFRAPDADVVIERALAKFPLSAALHERLRGRLLQKGGIEALDAHYAAALAEPDAPAAMRWFGGYASLVAAEMHRKNQRAEPAAAAYEQALARFTAYRDETGDATAAHYQALAHGGLARLALDRGDLEATFAALQQVFAQAPAAAAAEDGLGITAMQTAEMLRGRALDAENKDLLQRLERALQALPPEAFVLPEYERASRGQGNRPPNGRRR